MLWDKDCSCAVFAMRVSKISSGSRCRLRYLRAEAAHKRRLWYAPRGRRRARCGAARGGHSHTDGVPRRLGLQQRPK